MARLHGEKATIIQHCSALGILKTEVRKFDVHEPKPYAQYPISVTVWFVEPRKRNRYYYTMTPDGIRFLTIECGGKVVYDSRTDIPIDMDKWTERFSKNKAAALARDAENAKWMEDYRARHPEHSGVSVSTGFNFADE